MIEECNPLLIAKDNGAYAHADCEGVKFVTGFTDGRLVFSRSYKAVELNGPVKSRSKKRSIAETWAWHQEAVRAMEESGARIDRRSDFAAYEAWSREEIAAVP
jgi:hypothetical protein